MASREVNICSSEPAALSSMQRLSLADIEPDSSFNHKYITGKISQKFPLHSAGKSKRMKMVVTEDEASKDAPSPSKIIVFLTGAFAEEFIQFSVGDTIFISEALIEKSPSFVMDFIHPCHILVEKTRSRPSVWVMQTQNQSRTTSNTGIRIRQNPTTSSSAPERPVPPAVSSSNPPGQGQGPRPMQNGGVGTHTDTRTDPGAGPSTSTAAPAVSSTSGITGGSSSDSGVAQNNAATSGHPMDAWTVPDANISPTKRTYTYTSLKDLKEAPQVNVFGVVKFFKPPYKTRGPDHCMTVTLIDPTLDPSHRGLRCQLFRDDIKALPQVHALGDIVRFHRLKISVYNGEFQGQKGYGFQGLVFDGCVDGSLEPRATSQNFTLTDDDKRRVKELRLWSSRRTQLALDNRGCTLAKMYVGQYIDLTCRVVSVATLPLEKCMVVRVWDGTHYRGPVRVMDTSAAVSVQSDPEQVRKSEGLAVDVSLYDNHMETGATLKPGQFIKICNIHVAKFRQVGGPDDAVDMVELVLHHGTSYGRGVIELMEWEQGVKDMIRRMEDVIENAPGTSADAARGEQSTDGSMQGTPSRCMQRSATVITDHFHQRTSRIKDVMESEAPNKFRIRAKVIDYLPHNISDFIHLYCSKCKFRCRVPSPSKSTASGETSTSKNASEQAPVTETAPERRKYNLRNATSKEPEAKTPGENSPGVRTRSASQRSREAQASPLRSTKGQTPTRRPKNAIDTSGGSSAEEGSPGGRGVLRKRPASGVSGDQEASNKSPRKNRTGTSKMAARTPEKASASSAMEDRRRTGDSSGREQDTDGEMAAGQQAKRIVEKDIYGHRITVEMQSSGEDGEDEAGGGKKERRSRVKIDSLTVEEALLMVRLGMRLVHPTNLPTGHSQMAGGGSGRPSPDHQVYYICPRCSPAGGADSAGHTPLLQYRYCLKLFLDDGTGSIEVIADRQHAQTFFQGIQAANLQSSLDTKFKLEEAMAKLCPFPVGQDFDTQTEGKGPSVKELSSHPWLDCCIMSYPVNLGGTEVTKYQIFDTTLALDVE